MNAVELLKPDTTPAGVFSCGLCGLVRRNEGEAENCCRCHGCGEALPKGRTSYHDGCWKTHLKAIEEERRSKAEVVTDWTGWIMLPFPSDDKFFESMDDLEEWIDGYDPDVARPAYAYACHTLPFPGVDIDSVLDNVTAEMYEDAHDDLDGVDALEAALKAFNDANVERVTYVPDFTRVVLVPTQETTTDD